VALIVFASLVLWLRYVALPNVDSYREVVASSIEKASGMSVSVRAMRGHWGGLRPVLSLEGFALADRGGRVAFQLERAEVTLSWWSLLSGEVRFHDLDFYRPHLELRRGADGLIYLADKPLNDAGPSDEAAFTEWLLAQPRVGIHEATLTWRDDFLGAPEVRLTEVEIHVVKRHARHAAALTARPPRELAARVDLRVDVELQRDATRWRAAGEAYFESLNADLGRLRSHLPVPETLRSGVGSLRVWLHFSPHGVDDALADLRMRDARVQLAADSLPLELASISARAHYRVKDDGFSLDTEGLRFRLMSGVEAQPGRFSLSRTAPAGAIARVELRADGIDLKIAATLLDYFPVPVDLKSYAQRFAPRGRIADATIAWNEEGPKAYAVKGRFEDLAIQGADGIPGVTGLDGSIEGTESGGALRVAGRGVRLDLASFFRAPLGFDLVEMQARWSHAQDALHLVIDEARLANADAEGRFAGSWRSLPESKGKSPGFLDVKGTITRGQISRAARYLPNPLAETRAWLEKALQSGESPRLDFELKGDLAEFPFGGESTGHFLIAGQVRNARLRYDPEWPAVEAIDGSVRFHNRRMEIRAERATIFASRVNSALAVVEDLGASPPLLTIDGDVDTTGADGVRFLRESPLVNGPGAFTRAVSVEGPAQLGLHIDYPLSGDDPVRVAGDYVFAGATASVARDLALRDLRGRLSFTETGIRAPRLTGTLFGKPAVLAMASQPDGRVLSTLEGAIDSAVIAEHAPRELAARIAGVAEWKARILSGSDGVQLSIASDLKGLAVSLPQPLGKGASEARAVTLEIARLGEPGESAAVALAGGVHGRFDRAGAADARRWRAALKFGAPFAVEPLRDGLWLYGELPALDVDAWQAVFAAPGPATERQAAEQAHAVDLRGADLVMGRVRFLGRDFAAMHARLDRESMRWSGRLDSPTIAGEIQWSAEGRGRLMAKLDRFALPEAARDAAPTPQADQAELPALDIRAARFDFRGRTLGSLELNAEPVGPEWRIDRLDIGNRHSKFTSTGVWRRTGAGSLTTLAVKLDANNLNELLQLFGYGDHLRRGSGNLSGTLVWPGYPNEFELGNLAGTLRVEGRDGQFARIEPGAGKLLGLLSLQSLPRRAMFDFRDVFSEGFAFERIQGDVKIARGVLLTDAFEISGPSAFVSLSGEVSMPQETQALTMRVVPEVGEGMALAATVFGTPVLGLSTLLVSKLLRNPLGKAVAYEYQVTGSWDNPVVARTSSPPASAAAPASEEGPPARATAP
jgi:uncharacterized protein (TIGR02099 family)